MRIAVIGAGISGLVATYRLHADHDITLFEAQDYLGGHTHTVPVALDDESHFIDTGFIVFNDWTYPHFWELLRELDVTHRPTTMSFSVQDERTGLEYNGHSLNTLFAQRRNLWRPSFYRMVADILRFNREAYHLVQDCHDDMTVGEFLHRHGYSAVFSQHYLLPMGSAIWSCPLGRFADFPIRFIVDFYHNHGLLSVTKRPTWRVVQGGSCKYVEAMTRRFRDRVRLRLGTAVQSIHRYEDHIVVQPRGGSHESFDHVIFACHSDQALRILGDGATSAEREILAAFPYEKNTAVLHTDTSLLPRARRAWASWNYHLHEDEARAASVTYNMNILQSIRSRHTFCVTLNVTERIDPNRVLGRFEYSHPVFTTRRAAAQARHAELLTANRTSYCGAYWRNGFHEDGVVSALAVANALHGDRHLPLPKPRGSTASVGVHP